MLIDCLNIYKDLNGSPVLGEPESNSQNIPVKSLIFFPENMYVQNSGYDKYIEKQILVST